jgi:hypothetical protein
MTAERTVETVAGFPCLFAYMLSVQLMCVLIRCIAGLDRPDFKPEDPWEERKAGEHGPLVFEGTVQ